MSYLSSFQGGSTNSDVATNASVVIPATATYCTLQVLMRGSDSGQSTLSTTTTEVSLGSQDFTLDSSTMRQFNGFQAIECGYILESDMPSGTVTATVTRQTSNSSGMIFALMFFDDVVQNAPIVALNGYNSSPPDPVTTSVSTTTANSVIVDMIGTTSGASGFTTDETGQTAREDGTPAGGSASMNSSTRAVTSSGSIAMSWDTGGASNRTTHILLGLEEVGGGGPTPIPIFRRRIEG